MTTPLMNHLALIAAVVVTGLVQTGEAPRLTLQGEDQVMIVGSGLADRVSAAATMRLSPASHTAMA
jgi:hypothetical protein